MSTVTSSSPPGYVPTSHMLENCSLSQLVYELAMRLIGPEKAKSLKSSGIDVDALCQALQKTTSTPSTRTSAQCQRPSGTSTLPRTYEGVGWPKDWLKESAAENMKSQSQYLTGSQDMQLLTTHG